MVLTTAVAILAGLGLLVPGFMIAELATTGRARAQTSDLEIALRALTYALVVHLAFAWWTADVARTVGGIDHWPEEWRSLWTYAIVVLVAVPLVLGASLNVYLRAAERRPGRLPLLAAILGARDARDAFDVALSRIADGGWLIVELRGRTADDEPRVVGGLFGTSSAAGVSPRAHNLFLEEEWLVEPGTGARPPNFVGRIEPTRGLLIAADEIETLHVIPPDPIAMPPTAQTVGLA